jgi:predicted nuclease of predicted toxin-antitoxin system
MRFKIDENLHDAAAEFLLGHGHDAHTVHSEGLRGCDDATLVAICASEDRTLITFDTDFADIRKYPPGVTAGIILLRLSSQSRPHVLSIISRVVTHLDVQRLAGRLWVVSDSDIRIRES